MIAATKGQKWGKDFKAFSVALTPEEHTEYKIRAARFGVSVSEVCRMALADVAMWEKAAELKRQTKKTEGGK